MTKISLTSLILIFSSCYGINERTSAIADINYSCVNANWNKMRTDHSVENMSDSSFTIKIHEFENKPFGTELFYFDEAPKEIIAISTDHYQIRYIYNPNLSNQVLDGYSKKIDKNEIDRISNRINSMLEKYGCRENQ